MRRRTTLTAALGVFAMLTIAGCSSPTTVTPTADGSEPSTETEAPPADETGPVGGNSSDASAATESPSSSPKPTLIDLTGDWKQTNSSSTDSWQQATVTSTTIEINWVSDNGDTTSLYWAGSFTAPAEPGDTFAWTSNNDHSKTDAAMLASGDDTKDFTYENGVISYKVSALGTTTTVKLERP